jgi:hypothetical protein
MNGPPDTGGADIGHMANVGGTIPGMSALFKTASRTPEYTELGRQWKIMGKDYDDSAAPFLAGSSSSWSGTTPVYGPPGFA